MEIEYLLKNMFCSHFARVFRWRSFSKNFAISMQILKYILSKKLICSIAVLHLYLEILKKKPCKGV